VVWKVNHSKDDVDDDEVCKSQDSHGELGLTSTIRMSLKPVEIMQLNPSIKIVSGNEHLVCLTWNHQIFTMGRPINCM